jgi:hypothetical protein
MGLLQTKTEMKYKGNRFTMFTDGNIDVVAGDRVFKSNCYVHTDENDTHLIGSNGEFVRPVLSHHYTGTYISPNMSRTETVLDKLFRRGTFLRRTTY